MNSLLKTLLIMLAIPLIGTVVSSAILADINADAAAEGLPSVAAICSIRHEIDDAELSSACDEIDNITLLRSVSIWAAAIGLALPLFGFLAARFAGTQRERLVAIFRPLVIGILVTLSLLVIVHGAILVYAIYVGESYALGRIHAMIIGAIGLGSIIGAYGLIASLLRFAKPLQMTVIGKRLDLAEHSDLHEFLNKVASKLGAKVPTNVVLGLQPTFFATNAAVTVPESSAAVSGETLYLSAPLMRLLSARELASVVGHELGHFSGADTRYSLKFAPVYAGLGQGIHSLAGDEDSGLQVLARLPAAFVLSYIYDVFSTNERAIARDRELQADKAGAAAGSPMDLASALLKVSVFPELWRLLESRNLERLSEGKVSRNLAKLFRDTARFDVDPNKVGQLLASAMEQRIAHPTDSHPPVGERLTALGVNPGAAAADIVDVPVESAMDQFASLAQVEEALTMLHQQMMVGSGAVRIPEAQADTSFERAIYSLAASVILADGHVAAEEVRTAEAIGQRLLKTFDADEFREVCAHPDDIPDPIELASHLRGQLDADGREMLGKFLSAIAASESRSSGNEDHLVSTITAALSFTVER